MTKHKSHLHFPFLQSKVNLKGPQYQKEDQQVFYKYHMYLNDSRVGPKKCAKEIIVRIKYITGNF